MRIGTPLLAAALLCPAASVFPADSAPAAPPTISSFAQLWRAERTPAPTPYPVRMEVVVLYHDAAWKSMWARCGDTTNYLSFAELIPQTQPGQRILIEGHLQPQNGSCIAAPRITTLAPPKPLTSIDASGKMDQPGALHANLVTVSGLVDRQTDRDPAHLCIDIVAEGRLVTIWLPHAADTPVPQMEKAIVRATGVFCATANPDGQFTKLDLCVQSPADIAITGWIDRDERFAASLIPIQDLATAPTGRLAHVAGIVRATQPGVSVTLRDDTGQITVLTQQTHGIQLGEPLEAVGYPHTSGAESQLRQGLFRRAQQALPAARGLPRLRLATQLRELPADSAGRGYPVQLSGVVTWSHPDSDSFFILDASGGACVRRPSPQQDTPAVGDKVDIVGVSEVGDFAPVVAATGVYRAGNMDLPNARPVTLEQALTGVEEAQWVAMSGFVRDISVTGSWARLEIGTAAGTFMAVLPKNAPLAGLRGAVIRLRGVCAAVANDKRQLDSIALWVPDTSCISIVDPCPADPFSVPEQSIASLRQFGSQFSFNHRVRICARVVGQLPGRMLHVQDGPDGLLILSRDNTPLAPGDRVEAVGFPGRDSVRVVLHEAVFRKIDSGADPSPVPLSSPHPVNTDFDGRLVRIEGELLGLSPQERGTRLTVNTPSGLFEAVIDKARTDLPGTWQPDSRISLTGVYEVQLDEYRRPSSARLFLRRPTDVVIRRPAPWWTAGRALAATGVLALGALGGFAWVVALRRRVRAQTRLIREQYEKEKAARMETVLVRTSKLESLGLLAGGIAHDFNNLLTVISCNLSLLRLGQKPDPETEQIIADSTRASLRARDLTLQLLTFAKGGQPVLSAVSLHEVVRESGEFARHGSSVRCLYDFADDLWPAQVDKGQIGQVVHNLVLNAIQAMPDGGVIIISLRNSELPARTVADLEAGRYIQLTIADNGRGIPADALPRIFEPYFTTKSTGNGLGLATVHSIVRKHRGQIEVDSAPGKGTTFTLWLPAAADRAEPAPAVLPAEAPPRFAGRILFMDDEQPIRQTAALLFKRLGLESVTVEDGAAALREYAAARAAGRPFAAVILDLTIPGGLGGAETMARLREIDPQVCGIVSSGYSGDPVLANYREHGFRAIIRKPYEATEVAAILAQALPQPRTAA
jgi:signal transduction histidine kinase/CheY-like chemotaxis protein